MWILGKQLSSILCIVGIILILANVGLKIIVDRDQKKQNQIWGSHSHFELNSQSTNRIGFFNSLYIAVKRGKNSLIESSARYFDVPSLRDKYMAKRIDYSLSESVFNKAAYEIGYFMGTFLLGLFGLLLYFIGRRIYPKDLSKKSNNIPKTEEHYPEIENDPAYIEALKQSEKEKY